QNVDSVDSLNGGERAIHYSGSWLLNSVFSVVTHTGRTYHGRTPVLTTGTFLRGRAITGEAIWGAGRAGEAPAIALGQDLAALGFPLVRLKTGTPPRIDARTIDFTQTEIQPGSAVARYFGQYYAGAGGWGMGVSGSVSSIL